METEEIRRKSARHAWMSLAALCLVSLATSGLAWNTISLFVDPVVQDLGILRTQYMFIPTLIASLNMLMSMFAFGALEARFGIRKLLVAGLVFMGTALGLFASAQNLVMLYVAATLWGLGLSWEANSMRNAAIMQWFARRQSTMISIVAMVGQGTGVAFVALFGYLMAFTGWRPLLWVACVAHFVVAIVVLVLYRGNPSDLALQPIYADEAAAERASAESPDGALEGQDGLGFGEMLKTWQFWVLCVAWVVMGVCGDGIMANFVPIANDLGHADVASLALSTLLLSSTALSPVCGWLCDRFGFKSCTTLGVVCAIASSLMLRTGALSTPALFFVAIMLGVAWNASILPQAASTVEVFGNRQFAKKNTIFVSMQCLGCAIAAPFISAFYDFGGGTYNMGFTVTAALAIVTFFLFMAGSRPAKGVKKAAGREGEGEAA